MLTFPQKLFQLLINLILFYLERISSLTRQNFFSFQPRHVSNNRDSTERQTDLLATYLDGWNTELSSDSKTRKLSTFFFRFSLERTFRIFCFVFISIIGVSVSQWNESIYVNGVERLGCRTLRKIQISFRLFIFLLFIDISLLIPSRPFARSYLWSVPLSEFREEFENWKFFLYKTYPSNKFEYRWKNSFSRNKMYKKYRKINYFSQVATTP